MLVKEATGVLFATPFSLVHYSKQTNFTVGERQLRDSPVASRWRIGSKGLSFVAVTFSKYKCSNDNVEFTDLFFTKTVRYWMCWCRNWEIKYNCKQAVSQHIYITHIHKNIYIYINIYITINEFSFVLRSIPNCFNCLSGADRVRGFKYMILAWTLLNVVRVTTGLTIG